MKERDITTIFIIITRGFIVRNILRSGVLARLKDAGFRVVVFFDTNNKKEGVPEYLKKEFEDGQVFLEIVPTVHIKGYSRFARLTPLLIRSKSRWMHSQIGNDHNKSRAFFWKYFELAFFSVAGRIHFLKKVARYIERKFFNHTGYANYFETYKPALVFSTSAQARLDIDMMKEAKRRGISTISMPKGWDNVTQLLYRVVPDAFIVQNDRMKKEAAWVQRIDPESIHVTGFPQFDWYRRPEVLVSREEFCSWYGFDPGKKIIFFGSEGGWAPDDGHIVSLLSKWVNTPGMLSKSSQLIVRPHFTDVKTRRLEIFDKEENVVVDKNITLSNFFGDNWDPGIEEIKKFTNLVYHSDLLVTVASTLTLDCACFDKPLINIAFNVLHNPRNGEDTTPLLYTQDHYGWVLETGAVDIVHSEEELLCSINAYLLDPTIKKTERELLLQNLCYKVDGKSSERIVDVIQEVISKRNFSQ